MPAFSTSSIDKLSTCHPLLQQLFHEVIQTRDCIILCGHRGREEQEDAVRRGASESHYGQSRHNYTPSLAVDVMPYHMDKPHIRWRDLDGLGEFAKFVIDTAEEMKIPVKWGGHFRSFYDGPHWELIGEYHEAKVPM